MNSYLETAIAVIFVVVIFSIIAYVIQELVAANLQYRGKMLRGSLQLLLDGRDGSSTIVDQLYDHPQIKKLMEYADKLPSYVPSANFALAVIDEVARNAPMASGDVFEDFKKGLAAFSAANRDIKILLTDYVNTSANLKELQANIEKWFNEYMDRVSGWYKKNTVKTMRVIAICVALAFNVNIIAITKAINGNSTLKANLVAAAEKMVDQPDLVKQQFQNTVDKRLTSIDTRHQSELAGKKTAADSAIVYAEIAHDKDSILTNYSKNRIGEINTLFKSIDSTYTLPIGWNSNIWKETTNNFGLALIGWILAAIAISLGAPFWFDLLMKLVNIRRTGVKPKGSGDR